MLYKRPFMAVSLGLTLWIIGGASFGLAGQVDEDSGDFGEDTFHFIDDGDDKPVSPPEVTPLTPTARAELRFNRMDQRLRQLEGKLEEAEHKLSQLGRRIDGLGKTEARDDPASSDRDSAVSPDASLSATVGVRADAQRPGALDQEAPKLVGATALEQYKHAQGLIFAKEYTQARGTLQALIKAWPQDVLVQNSLYWIAETHYAQKDFDQAAAAFAKAYKKDPNGNKAPDSLLKIALCLEMLEDKEQSCQVLIELGKDFPQAGPHILNQIEIIQTRQQCNSG